MKSVFRVLDTFLIKGRLKQLVVHCGELSIVSAESTTRHPPIVYTNSADEWTPATQLATTEDDSDLTPEEQRDWRELTTHLRNSTTEEAYVDKKTVH